MDKILGTQPEGSKTATWTLCGIAAAQKSRRLLGQSCRFGRGAGLIAWACGDSVHGCVVLCVVLIPCATHQQTVMVVTVTQQQVAAGYVEDMTM